MMLKLSVAPDLRQTRPALDQETPLLLSHVLSLPLVVTEPPGWQILLVVRELLLSLLGRQDPH